MEGRIVGAFKFDRILVVSVICFVITVEEHLGLINAAVQQAVDTFIACMMILTKLFDELLFVDIVEVAFVIMLAIQ